MRENRVKRLWREGGAVVNGWLAIPAAFAAETMAHTGWDSLTIDMQHGVVDYQAMVTMLQAVSTTDVVPLVRVPWLDPGIIMKSLDAGAYGVICPMINNRKEAEQLVSACRYPPDGARSFGPVRATLYAGADYASGANDNILAIAMIETAEALDNLDEIMSTPGLDAIYVGPSDLSLALGLPPQQDREDGPVYEAQERILAAAKRHGVFGGIHTQSPTYALRMVELGYQFVTIGSDARFVAAQAKDVVAAMREGLG